MESVTKNRQSKEKIIEMVHTAFVKGYGRDLREEAPVRALLYDIYLYLIMVTETKYRNYPDDWQYQFASKNLKIVTDKLKELL